MKTFVRALLFLFALLALGEIADLAWLAAARATISGSGTSVTIGGNGSNTTFNFSFVAGSASDLSVIYTDASGNATTLAPNLYSVTLNAAGAGQLWGIGGTVTYPLTGSPIASGTTLTIARSVPYLQTVSSNNGQAFPQAVEAGLDLLEMQLQQVDALFGHTFVTPPNDACTSLGTLPSSTQRANQVLGFDATGCNPVALSALPSGTVSSAMQPVVDAASLSAGRAAFGLGSMAVENINAGTCGGASVQDDGSGNARVVYGTASDSTSQTVTCAFHLTQRIATGPITYTLPRANTLFNGFGFWIYVVSGGSVTLSPNASDTINGSSSGAAITLAQGGTYFVTTNAQTSGTWYINGASTAATTSYACTGADTNALNTVIASGVQSVTISGTCVVSTLNQLPSNFTLAGQNWLHDCIVTSSATGNVLTLANGDVLRNICISTNITRTAGDYVYVANASNVALDTVLFNGFFNALELHGVGSPSGACPLPQGSPFQPPCAGFHGHNLRMYGSGSSGAGDCILIGGTSGTAQPYNTGIYFSDVFCTGNNSNAKLANGVEIQAAGDVVIDRIETEYAGANVGAGNADVLIDPSGAASSGNVVQYVAVTNSLLDSGGANGVRIFAANGASVNSAIVSNDWIASNPSGDGISAATDSGNGSSIVDLQVINNHIINNANGVRYADSSNISVMNIAGNYIAGNTTIGFYAGTSSAGWRLNNNQIFGNGTGASFPTATLSNTFALGNAIVSNTTNVSGSPTLTINANNSAAIP